MIVHRIRGLRACSAVVLVAVLGQGAYALAPHGPSGPPPRRGGSANSSTLPSAPNTGGPSAPSPNTPGPAGPSTPGPAMPSPVTPRGPSPHPETPRGRPLAPPPLTGGARPLPPCPSYPRGAPIVFTRGASSRERLTIDWHYPVPEVGEQVLSYGEALQRIRGDDRRPMLVLRECSGCAGSDNALLTNKLDNEKTLIFTRWFRCVKLPAHITDATHPFHELFGDEHLFLVSADGSERIAFSGHQSQSELWKAMKGLIRHDYAKRPDRAVRELLHLLDRFDLLDEKEKTLRDQLDAAMVAAGPTAKRTVRIVTKLNALQEERQTTLERERELADLGLEVAGGE